MKNIISIVIASLLFSACSISKGTYSDATKWIPSDFDINKGTVLIETYPGKEKWNESMSTFVEENYPGKFVIADKKDIENKTGKYNDFTKYRFVFKWSTETSWRATSTFSQVDWYGRIYDRSSDKLYPTTRKTNNYGWKGYIPFINSIVKYSEKVNKTGTVASK
jgi:hypothetical protein